MITTLETGTGSARSRANRRGSSRVRTVLIIATFAALLAVLGYGIDGLGAGTRATYTSGSPSTWLPTQQLHQPVEHTLVGTFTTPAVTVAGDTIQVKTPRFSALAVVTGPLVPGEGYNYQPQYVVATWTVRIWDVKGAIPLSAADFDSIDHVGTQFHLLPPEGTTVPTSVATGHQVQFQLRAVVPIGEDLFRWAPNGSDVVAKWDNQVEND